MKVYYTDLSNCSNLLGYLFDFKCNKIQSKDIDINQIQPIAKKHFEYLVTNKMSQQLDFDINKDILLLQSPFVDRYLYADVKEQEITRVYLTETQLDELDQLLEIEESKDIALFEQTVNEIEFEALTNLGYDKADKVIKIYAKDEGNFKQELSSFLLPNHLIAICDQIKEIEFNIYQQIDFDSIVKEHIEANEEEYEDMEM